MIEIIVAASLPYQQEYIVSDSTVENSPTTTKKIAGAALVHMKWMLRLGFKKSEK